MTILNPKIYIETYGCQMNVSDSEVVAGILQQQQYQQTASPEEADAVLINTCAIRDNAEQRIHGRIDFFNALKQKNPDLVIGIIGCMAERIKGELFKKGVSLIAGPDAYRELPRLLSEASEGKSAINTELSKEETYAELEPVRTNPEGITAFVSIMRGCNNYCSYCVVPYTRGRERSRDPKTIIKEIQDIFKKGVREITLLGQNVNSYQWKTTSESIEFPDLIKLVAEVDPALRIRFATSHPKDISDKLIQAIADHPNICKSIHLPVQSGSSRILKKMNRKYDREWYLNRINMIRKNIPGCGITTDIITGFCGETEQDHQETLDLMKSVGYDTAYMFKYSERPGTYAAEHFKDDVPEEVKKQRLQEIIQLQNKRSATNNQDDIGKTYEVLIEGDSKKSANEFAGRTTHNKVVVFPKGPYQKGDYVKVFIEKATSATLIGKLSQ